MNRPQRAEIEAIKEGMRQWQSPAALSASVDKTRSQFGDCVITGNQFSFWREAATGAAFAKLIGAGAIRLTSKDRPDLQIKLADEIVDVEVTEALRPGRRRNDEYRQDERIDEALKAGTPLDPGDRRRAALFSVPEPAGEAGRRAVQKLQEAQPLTETDREAVKALFETSPNFLRMTHEPDDTTDIASIQMIRSSLSAVCRGKAEKGYDPAYWLLAYLNPTFLYVKTEQVEAIMVEATASAKDAFTQVWILWRDNAYLCWLNGVPQINARRQT
ncbi:hypothetical protein G3576_26195 [Roseomonas stagni]|uniref:Uncharacterized protein n=1 Tax=Falsiroseomonas algicola TaxID=2716930 RepID=A0A6M1LU64_9PROT|nr:hypothetical protein [Falsiroseomonas algicola]NGM23532.1 hypothetical protein [Falsiroseomonas algicola]